MADRRDRREGPLQHAASRLDEEFGARRGNTVSKGAHEDEAHPDITPQSPAELARKARLEASEEKGVVGKTRRVLEELDRDVGGEYERREDPTAPPPDPDEA